MKNRKRKTGSIALFAVLVIFAGSIVYNVFDNKRFIVVQQEITIDRLPESFDDLKILQISDLHGRYFGENQANLINTINNLDYDMIAFTGDMNASTAKDDSLNNSQAILDLLDGIEKKEYVFWVDGNTGPYAITRGNYRIWITPEMSATAFGGLYPSQVEETSRGGEIHSGVQSFKQEVYATLQEINGNDEVKILLIHTPKQINLTVEQLKQYGAHLDYDLILAGHYHGGQWRLPPIGALYIPSPTTGINQ